ncbi:MAG: ATP-binding cassette domain-containing protein, partial [Clostridia bacterium]
MLEVKSLSKAYVKGKVVIDIPEFCVEKGEIVGIFGANGCGKSTFLKCIAGLLNYQGAICVDGNDISRNCQIFEQIGIMIETPAFVGDLSGRQNIQLFVK